MTNSNGKTQLSKEERIKQTQERKEAMANDPDSIFWVPFSGSHGYKVAKLLREIDQKFNLAKRRAGFNMPVEQVKQIQGSIQKSVNSIWEMVRNNIPKVQDVGLDRVVYDLNNDVSEKRMLAKIRSSIGFLPRSSESGQLAMAVKQIEERGIVLQKTNLDGLGKLIDGCYAKVHEELATLDGNIIKAIDGKSPDSKTAEETEVKATSSKAAKAAGKNSESKTAKAMGGVN